MNDLMNENDEFTTQNPIITKTPIRRIREYPKKIKRLVVPLA